MKICNWVLLIGIMIASCKHREISGLAKIGDTSFVPTIVSITKLNRGWYEILLKDDYNGIALYLNSLSEGSHIVKSGFELNSQGNYPSASAICTAYNNEELYYSESGIVHISVDQSIGFSFSITASNIDHSKSLEVNSNGSRVLGSLITKDCLLEKIQRQSDSIIFIYGSQNKIIMEFNSNKQSRLYSYNNNGALISSIRDTNDRIIFFQIVGNSYTRNYTYGYDARGRLNVIEEKSIGSPYYYNLSKITYDDLGNVQGVFSNGFSSHYTTESAIQYLEYDQYRNPFDLLLRSYPIPEIYSINNPISASYSIKQGTTGVANTKKFYSYLYNSSGLPIKESDGLTITQYSYFGCN